jgi:hypothetical protein
MSKKKTGTFKKEGSPMRKKTTPATQVHKKKKGAGSYDRKTDNPKKETFDESSALADFVDAVLEKNYADAYKYLNSVVESKLQARIAKEYQLPLF